MSEPAANPTPDQGHRPEDLQASFCAVLCDEWARAGITDAVVSPGSRSTPLALAVAATPGLRMHVVLDERSASFLALGLARATGRAVALVCTSGTAAAQYLPAIAEADLDRVPLLVCTADRPPELHGIGAPQTMDQQALYGSKTRSFLQLGVPDAANRGAWRSFGARTVLDALGGAKGPGPVQINLPFREPLIGEPSAIPAGRPDGRAWHGPATGVSIGNGPSVLPDDLRAALSGRRGVIVAGAGCGEPGAVLALATALGWPVLADPRSGLRASSPLVIAGADLALRDGSTASALLPEIAVRLGAPWASKVMGAWLARVPEQILADPDDAWIDPARSATWRLRVDPTELCTAATGLEAAPGDWLASWQRAEETVRSVLVATLDDLDAAVLTEPAIARALSTVGSDGVAVVVSSSMPVRDIEWFGAVAAGPTAAPVLANRGVNGIDGVVSTAVGVALGAPGGAVCLVGDLAFLHDVGGLVTARATAAPVTFVVVDNGGGGIFEFLPQASLLDRERFEALFGTPQAVDIAEVARGFGLPVATPASIGELREAVVAGVRLGAPNVVLVRTDRRANVSAHTDVYAAIQAALATQR